MSTMKTSTVQWNCFNIIMPVWKDRDILDFTLVVLKNKEQAKIAFYRYESTSSSCIYIFEQLINANN